MKTLAIMQPYFFPYIGYWQLMDAVDIFVILDDVNYIRNGWIHKNRISLDDREHYLINPVRGASQNKKINKLEFVCDPRYYADMLRTLDYAYRDAAYYPQIREMIREIILFPGPNVAQYLQNQLRCLSRALGISTELYTSSSFRGDVHEKGQRGIIELCRYLDADIYINPIGGRTLYDKESFQEAGIDLMFLEAALETIKTRYQCKHPDYSILDLMARYSVAEINEMLLCRNLL